MKTHHHHSTFPLCVRFLALAMLGVFILMSQTVGTFAQSISIASLSPDQSETLYPGDRFIFKAKVTAADAAFGAMAKLVIIETSDQESRIFEEDRRSTLFSVAEPQSLPDLRYEVPNQVLSTPNARDSFNRKVTELEVSAILFDSGGVEIARSPAIKFLVKNPEITSVTPSEQSLGSEEKVRIVVSECLGGNVYEPMIAE